MIERMLQSMYMCVAACNPMYAYEEISFYEIQLNSLLGTPVKDQPAYQFSEVCSLSRDKHTKNNSA